jgi:hypothetical protein
MDLALHIAGGLLAALYAVRCGVAGRSLLEVVVLIAAFGFVREGWQHAATPPWEWSAHVVKEAGGWGIGAGLVFAHWFTDGRRRALAAQETRATAGAWWQRSS